MDRLESHEGAAYCTRRRKCNPRRAVESLSPDNDWNALPCAAMATGQYVEGEGDQCGFAPSSFPTYKSFELLERVRDRGF